MFSGYLDIHNYATSFNVYVQFFCDLDEYVMSITFPKRSSKVKESRLVSPLANSTSNTCVSFLIYFGTSSATLSIGTARNVSYDYDNYDVTILGTLYYPFDSKLIDEGESDSLLRIRLNIPPGIYHLVFSANGVDGRIYIWDIKTNAACNNSS